MNDHKSLALNQRYQGKTVLVTGHTGFKGSWLTAWLLQLGAKVVGLSLDPSTEPSHFVAADLSREITDLHIDIRDRAAVEGALIATTPDFVFHLAAQALVRRSYDDPLETWHTNLMGTLNILEGLRKLERPCAVVLVTSDKCYDNVEWLWGYRETDALGGPDPYSASKGAAELAIKSHIRSYFPKTTSKVRIASARAGNVIGGGDWSVDRIVPDCVKAWSSGETVNLRNPHATRPWQHVLEPLSGYLSLAVGLVEQPHLHGEPFNLGPLAQQNYSVLQLVEAMSSHWSEVRWADVSNHATGPHEAGLLKLNCDKALSYLRWTAAMNFEQTVKMTTEWYRSFYEDPAGTRALTDMQIQEYTAIAQQSQIEWAQ
jgi:CDP-glucose 4,6-dehydratase